MQRWFAWSTMATIATCTFSTACREAVAQPNNLISALDGMTCRAQFHYDLDKATEQNRGAFGFRTDASGKGQVVFAMGPPL